MIRFVMGRSVAGCAGIFVLALACVVPWIAGAQENLRTEIGDVPWPPMQSGEKVVYGDDDRIDVYEETDPTRLSRAMSTCALIDTSDLTNNGNGTFTINLSAYTIGGDPACVGEPFGSQPTAAFCSGFLVSTDLVATAGHCIINDADLATFRFVFGFDMIDATTPTMIVNADQVATGVELISHTGGGSNDHALVRISSFVDAPIAPIRRTGSIALNDPVGVIGHPSGLPKKIAFGAATEVLANGSSGFFEANLDTYGGNSGSPVFNQTTGFVEGILVRGAPDFVDMGSCFVSNVLPDSAGTEDSTRITLIQSQIPAQTILLTSQTGGGAFPPASQVDLHIEISGMTGTGTAVWEKDGIPVVPSGNVQVNYSQSGHILMADLTILNVDASHEGVYSVSGSNAVASFERGSLSVELNSFGEGRGGLKAFYEEGDTLIGTIPGNPSPPYQWFRNGMALSDGGRVSGATSTTLTITDLVEADTGQFSATLDDGTKAIATFGPHHVTVVAPGALPAAGALALSLLVGAFAGGGAAAVYRRKRRG